MATREHTYKIPLFRGIAPEVHADRNTLGSHELFNARVIAGGLESTGPPLIWCRIPLAYAGATVGERWPFPQAVAIRNLVLIFGKSVVYRADPQAHKCRIYQTGIATVNHPWAFAQDGEYLAATNDTTVLQYIDGKLRPIAPSDLSYQMIPPGRAMCAWGGRVIVGNAWAYGGRKKRFIFWTKVQHADARIEEYAKGGGAGFAEVDWPGEILALRAFGPGAGFVAYGTGGVSHFRPTGNRAWIGEQVLTRDVGIAGPLAVTGDENLHIWLGADGNVYQVTPDAGIKSVGYRHKLKMATRSCPVLTFDRARREVYGSGY